jgi:parallel beta-helix repeat protein
MLLSRFFGRRDVRSSRLVSRRRFSVEALEGRQLLATFTVTSVNDSGPGSLRQAIISADGASGASTIQFSIGTGKQTITPTSALPAVGSHVTIDATTQPGYSGQPLVAINGSKAGSRVEGLTINGGNDEILGLAIDHFSGDGILIQSNGNTIAADDVGLSTTGSAAGNGGSGIIVRGSNNTIGSVSTTVHNVISANGWRGVWIDGSSSSGNVVEGNEIGTNPSGTAAVRNGGDGVSIVNAPNNTIGGTAPGAGNLISGNTRVGIWIDGATASGNQVQGNLIGTDITGESALGNGLSGVMTEGAPNNTIGGTTAAARNVISGNALSGVWLDGTGSRGNVVEGNDIGASAAGTAALGNGASGVTIVYGSAGNVIGGTAPGTANTIVNNLRSGVTLLEAGKGNLVEGNVINANGSGQPTAGLGDGVFLMCSAGETVSNNTIEFNRDWGINLQNTGSSVLTGNTFTGNGLGDVHS